MAASPVTSITVNGRSYRKVTEGQATILAPFKEDSNGSAKKVSSQSNQPRNNDEGSQAVFYNPIQQYNRDLSVLAIKVYGESAVELKRTRTKRNLSKYERKRQRKEQLKSTVPTAGQSEEVGDTTATKKRKADDAELNDKHDEKTKRSKSIDEGQDDIEVQQLSSSANPSDAIPKNGTANHTITVAEPSKKLNQPQFTILDALSASGLRAIRYAKEIPFATTIVANDMLPEAVEAINLNIEHNGLKDKVFANTGDAKQYMYSKSGDSIPAQYGSGIVHKFDVVDLDPYGTAAPFLDAAIQSLSDGGLLCVTCTDAGVWASNGYPEKAYALYNGTTLKGAHSHEAGLRLILHSIASTAAKYGIAIEPLLSLSIDFYGRCFIRVHRSQQEVKLLAGTTMMVYNCDQGCGAWQTQPVARNTTGTARNGEPFFKHGYSKGPVAQEYCEHCGTKTHLGGPMWAGPLHNPVFVQKILDQLPDLDKSVYGTTDRIKGMLSVALEEEELDWKPATHKNKEQNGNEESGPPNGSSTMQIEPNQSAIIPRLPPHLLSPSPLFFIPSFVAKVVSMITPTEDPFRGAFLSLGYTCTRSHCKPGSFKTNAPWKVIWEVVREYIRQKDSERIPRLLGEGEFVDKRSVKQGSPGYTILKKLRGRNGDLLKVTQLKEDLLQRLGHGMRNADVESREDLKAILQAALYELEHQKSGDVSSVDAAKPTDDANGSERITGKALIEAGGHPSELEIVFDAKLGKAFRERGEKLVRYQVNPRANWGPMVRAGAS